MTEPLMVEVTPIWVVALLLWAGFTLMLWKAVFRLKDERDALIREKLERHDD